MQLKPDPITPWIFRDIYTVNNRYWEGRPDKSIGMNVLRFQVRISMPEELYL